MQDVLQQLGITARNSGASTANEWAEGNGKIITSFSPVDGKKIAEVNSCTDKSFALQKRLFWNGACGLRQSVVILSGKLVMN